MRYEVKSNQDSKKIVEYDGADIKEPKRDAPKRTRQRRVSETTSEQISLLQTVQKPKRGRRPKIT